MQPRTTSTVGSAVELHGVDQMQLPIQYGQEMQQHGPQQQQFEQGVFLPQAPARPPYFNMAAADAASQEMQALPFHRGPLFPVAESAPMQQSILAPSFVEAGRSQMVDWNRSLQAQVARLEAMLGGRATPSDAGRSFVLFA